MGWPDRAAESSCRLAMLLDGTTRNGPNRPQSAGDIMATANEHSMHYSTRHEM
jgi:hypothetical protein